MNKSNNLQNGKTDELEFGIRLRKEGNMDVPTMAKILDSWKESRLDSVVPTKLLKALPIEFDYSPNYNEPPEHQNGVGLKFDAVNLTTKEQTTLRVPITETALKQVAEKIDVPIKYIQKCRTAGKLDLICSNFNEWFEYAEEKKWFIRTMNMNLNRVGYAILSTRYRPIDCPEVFYRSLQTFKELEDEKGVKVSVDVCNLTIDRMYIRASVPYMEQEIRENDAFVPAVVISDSPSGLGRFQVEPLVIRKVCINGLIGDDVLSRIHIGKEWDEHNILSLETLGYGDLELMGKVRDYIRATFDDEIFQKWLERFRNATTVPMEEPAKQLNNFITRYEIPISEKDALLNRFTKEADPTQFGFVNTITAYAKGQKSMEKRVELERVAGRLLKMDGEKFNKHLLTAPRKTQTEAEESA